MGKRFEYDRMSSQDFLEFLQAQDMPPEAFARIFGVPIKRVKQWVYGQEDIPIWVPIVCGILSIDGAIAEARKVAAQYIRLDNDYPDRGEYPYLKEGHDDGG